MRWIQYLIEQTGIGMRRIRQLCEDHRVAEPAIDVSEYWVTTFTRQVAGAGDQETHQVTHHETHQVANLIRRPDIERTRVEILDCLGLKDRMNLARKYLRPALADGLIEMTIPDKPKSRKLKYRLTDKCNELKASLGRVEWTIQSVPGTVFPLDMSCISLERRVWQCQREGPERQT